MFKTNEYKSPLLPGQIITPAFIKVRPNLTIEIKLELIKYVKIIELIAPMLCQLCDITPASIKLETPIL